MAHQSLQTRRQRIYNAVAKLAAGPQRRYPAELRRQIARYARERLRAGARRCQVGAELGVSDPTLLRMLERNAPQRRLRRVRVVAEATAPVAQRVIVRAPGGLVIEGLDTAGVAALVRALS